LELALPKLSETQPRVEVLPQAGERWHWQFVRFSVVGIVNTLLDVITLNILLCRFPTHSANLLLVYNSFAYCLGALNSFCLNKYWTFKQRNTPIGGEVARFAAVSIMGILCSDSILWFAARLLHPLIINSLLWANISKGMAIAGTMIVSYLGMRLWVFNAKVWSYLPKFGPN
jgi:putative flippase GtrA